jgi:hypothetical protein
MLLKVVSRKEESVKEDQCKCLHFWVCIFRKDKADSLANLNRAAQFLILETQWAVEVVP